MYLSLNNTLGGAFCIDGKLIPGANQKAGEFGHMILVPGGKKCYCGKQGCADAYCAASVLTDDTKETLEQFMKKVEEQDGQAVKVWKEYLNNLAILISNLRMAYDMDIILGGEVGGYLADHMITLGNHPSPRASSWSPGLSSVCSILPLPHTLLPVPYFLL